jgi:hypothetical protein
MLIAGPVLRGPVREAYSPENEIPSGQTRKVSIDFHVDLHLHLAKQFWIVAGRHMHVTAISAACKGILNFA